MSIYRGRPFTPSGVEGLLYERGSENDLAGSGRWTSQPVRPSTPLGVNGGRLSAGFRVGLFALALLSACHSGPAKPEAERWSVKQMVAQWDAIDPDTKQPKRFGGWTPRELVVQGGLPLVFQPGVTQAGVRGLTLFPAVTAGQAAAFVITDVWQDAPTPWVQPVWLPRDEAGRPMEGVRNVFPVADESTFYSPFWRAEELLTRNLTDATYRDSRDVLSMKPEDQTWRTGSVIFCPIVLPDTGFADDGTGPKDPMTLSLLTLKPVPPQVHPGWLPREQSQGWVDQAVVNYLDFGLDHALADEQTLSPAQAFFFVRQAGDPPLPLAAVLPAEALRHALVQRVDVVLPPGAAPFIPANRPELRALLATRDPLLTVPVITDAALDLFPQFTLRVAANPACFTAPAFPAACDWLDSPARLQALRSDLRLERAVQLGLGVVLP